MTVKKFEGNDFLTVYFLFKEKSTYFHSNNNYKSKKAYKIFIKKMAL